MLKSQCLVVAIWDQDSHSRDDYMAGVRNRLLRFGIGNWKNFEAIWRYLRPEL